MRLLGGAPNLRDGGERVRRSRMRIPCRRVGDDQTRARAQEASKTENVGPTCSRSSGNTYLGRCCQGTSRNGRPSSAARRGLKVEGSVLLLLVDGVSWRPVGVCARPVFRNLQDCRIVYDRRRRVERRYWQCLAGSSADPRGCCLVVVCWSSEDLTKIWRRSGVSREGESAPRAWAPCRYVGRRV